MSERKEDLANKEKPAKERTMEEAEEPIEDQKENGIDFDDEDEKDEEEQDDADENEENEEEEDDESSEEELGLLERPVEILSRKRDRKSTERYIDKSSEKPKSTEDELDYSKGKGIKLGDVEYVRFMIERTKAEQLKTMHNLLFRKVGKITLIKKNIRAFNGFPFEKDSTHFTKLKTRIERPVMNELKFICNILGLDKKGEKDTVRERIIEYLMEPKDMEKTIPSKPKKKSKTPSKKKKKSKKEGKKEKKTKESNGDDNEMSEASDVSEDEEEKPAKTPKKKTSPAKKSDSAKKSSAKKKKETDKKKKSSTPIKISLSAKKSSTKKKTPASESKRKNPPSDDSDDDDDAPLVKKTKREPSDAEVREVVAEILKDADLEQVTMKTVCKQVYDRFPSFDLTPRKDFIKTTVKEIMKKTISFLFRFLSPRNRLKLAK